MKRAYLLVPLLAAAVGCGTYDSPVDKSTTDTGWTDIGNGCDAVNCVKQITVFDRKCIVLNQDNGRSGGISCDWAPTPAATP